MSVKEKKMQEDAKVCKKGEKTPAEKPVNYEKAFLNTFHKITNRHNAWSVWRDFICMLACAISNAVDKSPEHYEQREKMYMECIKKYNADEQAMFPQLTTFVVMGLETNPEQDLLGRMYMNLNLGNGANGQFFTPYNVCKMMAAISGSDMVATVKEDGFVTINDCCCGAGATLIAGVHEAKRQLDEVGMNFQNHVMVVAQDIDMVAALMCYIQLSFLGVAASVKIGNSLTDPITEKDSKENYWFSPMYFSDVWTLRRAFRSIA